MTNADNQPDSPSKWTETVGSKYEACYSSDAGHKWIPKSLLDQLRRDAIQSDEAEEYFWKQTTGKSRLALLLDKARRDAVEEFKKANELVLTVETVAQIEMEAKKELLDEFKSFLDNYHNLENKFYAFRYTAEGKVAYYRYDGLLKQFELFRAKTLGENVK